MKLCPPISLISGECTRRAHISAGGGRARDGAIGLAVKTERFFITIHAAGNLDRKNRRRNKDESGRPRKAKKEKRGKRKGLYIYSM